jgi:hypothetical protein
MATVWTHARRKLRHLRKHAYWRLHGTRGDQQAVFVCGAAKSGKTLLCSLLDRDIRVALFREESELSGHRGHRLRFRPPAEIAAALARCPAAIVVAEAKVESQNAASLLRAFPGSKVIWAWRRFEGAVSADVQRFSSQRENLLAIVRGDPNDWRSENVSAETREVVLAHYAPDMPRADAAALFWYSRNVLWFEQALDRSSAALLVNYEDLCRAPALIIGRVYELLGTPVAGTDAGPLVHRSLVDAGADLVFHPDIQSLCSSLTDRLTACGRAASQGRDSQSLPDDISNRSPSTDRRT